MDNTPLRLPDYLYDSEEDDDGSVKTYQTNASDNADDDSIDSIDHNTSDETEPIYSSLISQLETSTHIAYYLNHMFPPKKWNFKAEEFLYSYMYFISILGKEIKDEVLWLWKHPEAFSYSEDYLDQVLSNIQQYIDNIYASYGCNRIEHKDTYDTMEMVNTFYVKLKNYNYDIADVVPMKEELRSCLKTSSSTSSYKDLIYKNHIFDAFCICDE